MLGESYRSYLLNLFEGMIWGDDIVAAAIGRIFNIASTIIMPILNEPVHLFHDVYDTPDVLLIGNGGPVGSQVQNTHLSSTKSQRDEAKLPGTTMNEEHFRIKLYDSYNSAKCVAQDKLIEQENKYAFERLLGLR